MPQDLNESFAVEEGFLVRRVVPRRGTPYEHRCAIDIYQTVAHVIDEMKGAAFVMEDIQRAEDLPWTQIAVAVAFMKDRGLLEPVHGRKHVAGSECVHLDAMVEYHVLAHFGPAHEAFAYGEPPKGD